MGFGTKFRELREKRGISLAAADEAFGLTREHAATGKTGSVNLRKNCLKTLQDTSVSDFMT